MATLSTDPFFSRTNCAALRIYVPWFQRSFRSGVQTHALTAQPPLPQRSWEMLSLHGAFSIMDGTAELPSLQNFICTLQKCIKVKSLAYAKSLHVHICNNGLEVHRDVGNLIVSLFVECGSLSDAQQVFNRLLHRNVSSWTSLMLGYIRCGQSLHAFNLYQEMLKDSVHPNKYTLIALLKACSRLKILERGREIHVQISQMGLETNVLVGSTLIHMYAKCGSLLEAQEVFQRMPVQNTVSWTALIAGYAEHGPAQEALKCFEQMQLKGSSPNAVTLIFILKACGSIRDINKGREIHTQISQKGFDTNIFVASALMDMYAKCSSLLEAREVFDRLPVRDVASWNALIAGYAEHGPGEEALKCFEQMQLEGFSPSAVTFVCVLKACSSIGAIRKGRGLHTQIAQHGFDTNVFVGNALIHMYAKCGAVLQAQEVFDKLLVRNAVSWNALIAGYAEHGPSQKALKCFGQMQLQGISPNAVTFVCVLKACGNLRAIDKGRKIHTEISLREFDTNIFVASALVDMYARSASLSEAQEVFDKLPVHDIVLWNALIAGYAEYGPGQEALECYEVMQQEGFSPNAITFVCVLKACAKTGAINKGREIHSDVIRSGFETNVFVGNTLIKMYAKSGLLSESQEVFNRLPVRNSVSWNTLIAGYTEHGRGQEVPKCLEQMQWRLSI